jgi:hypothetical protein
MIAARLQRGDEVRVVSPAVSLGFIPEEVDGRGAARMSRPPSLVLHGIARLSIYIH